MHRILRGNTILIHFARMTFQNWATPSGKLAPLIMKQKMSQSDYTTADYSSRREAFHDVFYVSDPQPNPLAPSTEYQTQSKFPGQDTDVNKLKIPTDLLQNLKPWFQSNNSPSPNKKPQSYLQIPCTDGAECSHMPEKRRQTYHSPKLDEYSPHAEAIAVSLPTNQQYPFESSSNPIKSILSHRQYHVDQTYLQ